MPPVQEGAIFKLKSGAWAYRLPRDPITRRRRQEGGFKTKGEARRALDDAMLKLRLGHSYRPDMTFDELADEFFAQYVGVTERTRRTMREWLVAARAQFGDMPIERLDARMIAAWRATLRPAFGEKQLRALRQVLNYAVRVRLLDRNPVADVSNVKAPRAEIRPFESWSAVEAVADELAAPFRPIPVFAAGTGLRPEEWIALRVGDVNLAERVVTVRRVYSSGEWRDAPEKGKGARRRVPLRARVIEALAETGRLGPGKDPDALLFPARGSGPIDLHNFREREWRPALIAGGFFVEVKGDDGKVTNKATYTPYALRHTYAAWALAAGVNIYTLARRMGTSVKMIDETYGHFARDAEDYERDLMDAYDAKLDAEDEARSAVG
ncbi:MAG TPA: tyrosine-type recombinase/integrase [Gaiellaceae bacterium]|nr:tyrosine-type recombinase/integrase [Gaiellaceae bacterium]